jgi:hypothetical protein
MSQAIVKNLQMSFSEYPTNDRVFHTFKTVFTKSGRLHYPNPAVPLIPYIKQSFPDFFVNFLQHSQA